MNFEYKSEHFGVGRCFRGYLRYPLGDILGDFYEKVADGCREWAEREYAEYVGRMITYRFSARVDVSEDRGANVCCEVSLSERGTGRIERNYFCHSWGVGGTVIRMTGENIQNMQKQQRK